MHQRIRHLFVAFFLTTFAVAQNFEDGFSFEMPHDDTSSQLFLPIFPATPIDDFIGISADGHFTANGQNIRFWGVNFTTGACFPLKQKAAFIAGRMRKMGINLVRFHHMDNPWTDQNGTIFIRNSGNTRQLNPTSLDRFHFLLAQMKQEGIYANINLHVTRTFLEGDGVPDADSLPDFAKIVTFFDPHLIALQKEYAQQLLSAPNPYTGLSTANDPVVAMIEISNENTLYGAWKSNQLQPIAQGGLLPQRHARMLDDAWQAFLLDKYGDHKTLKSAWSEGTSDPGSVMNKVINGDFESGTLDSDWTIEQHQAANGTATIDSTNAYEGTYCAKVDINNQSSEDWHLQFYQFGLTTTLGKTYEIRFAARADRPRTAYASLMKHTAPYTWYGGTLLNLDTEWQTYKFTIVASEDNLREARLTTSLANQASTVWLDNVRFSEVEIKALEEDENLEEGNIRRVPWTERQFYGPKRIEDQTAFYIDLQTRYFDELYAYLKDTLGVRVPITGTNALTGHSDAMSMRHLDYVDDHAYWNHPSFPLGYWSDKDWLIANEPMVREETLGTMPNIFGGLAAKDKPYTISEYNHPFPNRFQAEMFPILTAYASLHNADGLMIYDYNGSHSLWEADRVDGFFSIHRNHALMGLSPFYAYIFRQQLLQADPAPITIDYSDEFVYSLVHQDDKSRWQQFHPYDNKLALSRAIRTTGYEATDAPDLGQLPPSANTFFSTVTNETAVNTAEGLLSSTSPKYIGLTGFLEEANGQSFGQLTLESANDFGTLAWVSLTDDPLENSQRSAIVLSSKLQNSDMIWQDNQTVNGNWGSSPTSIFPLDVRLQLDIQAAAIKLYPLDERGQQSTPTTYLPDSDGHFHIHLDQAKDRTLWYGIETLTTQVKRVTPKELGFELNPNPAESYVRLSYRSEMINQEVAWTITDNSGKVVLQGRRKNATDSSETLDIESFAPGIYFARLRIGQVEAVRKFVVQH
ncbi:MAG: carbohydrate binding domain-containing protein [Bacteroidota bacterium]